MRTDRYRPNVPPYMLYGLLGLSLVLNLWMVNRSDSEELPEDEAVAQAPTPDVKLALKPAVAVSAAVQPQAADLAQPAAAHVAAQPVSLEPAVAGAPPEGWEVVRGDVEHSLARTFKRSVGSDKADAVSAVYSRLFMWDLDLRRDLRKGDKVTAAWRVDDAGEYDMPVAWFTSQKLGRSLKAYRFHAPGDVEASYWYADGTEVPLRLVGGPIEGYAQITSLLKDRPNHRGMDFKAAVGTEVVSPKAGTVTRVNWNWRANGNCAEVRYADGTQAKFLHLEKVAVEVGQHVASGQVVGTSGNTGHSTAPHLHYQLDRGDRSLDPLDYHDTVRRTLSPADMPDFQRAVASYDALLGEMVAVR